jgi:glycine cleavage system H protein
VIHNGNSNCYQNPKGLKSFILGKAKRGFNYIVEVSVKMSKIPTDLLYTKEHEWIRQEGDVMRVGITDYAQEELHEIVMVELPSTGTKVKANEVFGTVDSVKATSELFSPVSGEVVEMNEKLEEAPELVNNDPYGEGWMIVIKPADSTEIKALMKAEAYESFLAELAK